MVNHSRSWTPKLARQIRIEWPDPEYPPSADWPIPIGLQWRGPLQIRARFRRVGAGSVSKTFEAWELAANWLGDQKREAEKHGQLTDRGLIQKTTLAQALKDYLKEETPLKRGAVQEEQRIKYWLDHPLAQRHLSTLTVADFQQWIKSRIAEGKAPTTITNALSPVSKTYQSLATKRGFEGLINPIKAIIRPKARRGREVFLSFEDEQRLLAACDPGSGPAGRGRKSRSPWLGAMVKVALTTAMRQGEIRALKDVDLDLDRSCLRVQEAKDIQGAKPRDVPLTPDGVAVFREILKGPRPISGGVFPATTKDQVSSAFANAARRAGLPEITFHDLRHTATTRLAAIIRDVMVLRKFTGHESIQVLMRCYNPTAAELAKRYRDDLAIAKCHGTSLVERENADAICSDKR